MLIIFERESSKMNKERFTSAKCFTQISAILCRDHAALLALTTLVDTTQIGWFLFV
jgi:hypothetical protein